ncbi:hypothetical protein G5C66_19975 [Nocardioides sp. KC13]|uniref:Uncharacterized protein n=1 Tax=Nocardioides turkmenicus TaxID=2711220 RepID=A0A6M1R438_9ACTN|nr:hypothetical protein [Nocardioides sp. KC13]NGN95004.1 hypothetical protein [Nocardioides sp. KC13]
MGTAIVSGLFAVVLACLAWALQNGSRRARLLSRIERYTQILKDIPDGHPARLHLDAALAAEAAQLEALIGSKVPQNQTPPVPPSPRYAPAPIPDGTHSPPADTGPSTMDDIFGTDKRRPTTPGLPPQAQPPPPPPSTPVPTEPAQPAPTLARSAAPLRPYASVVLGLLAAGFAVLALWLTIDQVLR